MSPEAGAGDVTFEADGLVVRYPGVEAPAIDRVTFVAPAGSLYAVLGPNGSGKSTLMRALLGTVDPEEGVARVRDRPAALWDRRALAREVGVVPQEERVTFPVSVRELVAMGRYPHLGALRSERPGDREAIARALERCDVGDLASRAFATLSGGERQRARIARALAQEPRALALDEPTASLDVRHEMAIFRLLRRSVESGMSVLLITHKLNLAARFADRLLLLDEGRVAAEGPAEAVMTPEVLEAVYGWPMEVRWDEVAGAPQVTALDAPDGDRSG